MWACKQCCSSRTNNETPFGQHKWNSCFKHHDWRQVLLSLFPPRSSVNHLLRTRKLESDAHVILWLIIDNITTIILNNFTVFYTILCRRFNVWFPLWKLQELMNGSSLWRRYALCYWLRCVEATNWIAKPLAQQSGIGNLEANR